MPYEPFLGEIMLWPAYFAPRNWAFCNGQLLSISQNPALFSLLGTQYGGDGRTTFALPDLRGRVVVGTTTGGSAAFPFTLGDRGGSETMELTLHALERATENRVDIYAPRTERQPVVQPYLALNYVIALWGIYPARD